MIPEILATDRLVLRQFNANDAAAIFRYASNPEVTRYMDWPTHASLQVSRDWIEHTLAAWEQNQEYTWGITTREGGDTIVGAIGCTEISHKVSFGYVLDQDYWGKGIATEAATALVETLSKVDGVKRIWATCDCANDASAKVLTKAGCEREGILRNWSIGPNLPGAPARDDYVFAKVIAV